MMNAIEFVKKFGLVEAKKQLEDPKLVYFAQVDYQFMHDLKQIVDSFEWVEKFGGLDGFKDEYMSRIENNECVSGMSNAIDLVEQCK